jgi:predicted ATPase
VAEEGAARRLEVRLRVALGNVAIADAGLGSAETGQAFGRAVELCRALGDDAPLAMALWGLGTHRMYTGDLPGALRLAEESAEAARRQGPSAQRLQLLTGLGWTQHLLGRSGPALATLEEAAAAGDGSYDPGAGAFAAATAAQAFLARLLACLGALERSAAHASGAVERARRAGHLPSLAVALSIGCNQAWLVRDTGLLRDRVRALAELTEAQGLPYFAARARGYAGWLAVEEGRAAEGAGLIADGLAAHRDAGIALNTSHGEAMLSEAHLLGGDMEAALAHIEEALRISARTGEAWFDADLHRRLGGLLLRLDPGAAARAEDEFRRALGIARSQSARLLELRVARDLARLRREQGRLAEARGLLAPVYAAFTEGFAFPDLVEARALLEDLGAAPADAAGRRQEEVRTSQGPDRLREPAPGR